MEIIRIFASVIFGIIGLAFEGIGNAFYFVAERIMGVKDE